MVIAKSRLWDSQSAASLVDQAHETAAPKRVFLFFQHSYRLLHAATARFKTPRATSQAESLETSSGFKLSPRLENTYCFFFQQQQ